MRAPKFQTMLLSGPPLRKELSLHPSAEIELLSSPMITFSGCQMLFFETSWSHLSRLPVWILECLAKAPDLKCPISRSQSYSHLLVSIWKPMWPFHGKANNPSGFHFHLPAFTCQRRLRILRLLGCSVFEQHLEDSHVRSSDHGCLHQSFPSENDFFANLSIERHTIIGTRRSLCVLPCLNTEWFEA